MRFLKLAHACRPSFARLLCALLLLSILSLAALAQGPPPNLDFNDNPNGSALYNSTGRAFIGTVSANVFGRIRNGRVNSLNVTLDPYNNGPYKLDRLTINFDEGPSSIAPKVYWYDKGPTTKHMIIKDVEARQDFSGTAVYSKGTAEVQLTFVDNQPGKVVVIYKHKEYSVARSKVPSDIRAYSGTVFSGSPLFGRRLYFELR